MKTGIPSIITMLFVTTCGFVHLHGKETDNADIRIRIHVPGVERLANEEHHNYIVRIENRGRVAIPVLSTLTYIDDGRVAPIQFRIQTPKDAESGSRALLDDWAAITKQAEPSEWGNHPAFLEGDQAIELIMAYTPVGLLPDGVSRIACQIGPNQTAYSNWVEIKTLPAEDTINWPILSVEQLTPGQIGTFEFVVHTTASGQWLFARNEHMKDTLTRICMLPDGERPTFESDMKKHQVAIIFRNHPEATTYFNAALGICRSTPWPDEAKGSELSATPIPVDAPSPLEFPQRLFAASSDPLDSPVTKYPPIVQTTPLPDPPSAYCSSYKLWVFYVGTISVGLLVLLLYIRTRKN